MVNVYDTRVQEAAKALCEQTGKATHEAVLDTMLINGQLFTACQRYELFLPEALRIVAVLDRLKGMGAI